MKDKKSVLDNFLKEIDQAKMHLFNEVYKAYFKRFYLIANRFIQDEQDASDITQEVFVALYDKVACLKTDGEIRKYLYHSLRQACKDYQEKKEVVNTIDLEPEYFSQSLERMEIEAELIQMLHEEIKKLPPQRKKIVQLYLNNLSSAEVATEMKLSQQTVINQRVHAVATLRKAFM